MNTASCFFRLCRQRQLQTLPTEYPRQAARKPYIPHARTFASSRRFRAQTINTAAQSDAHTEQPPTSGQPTSLFYGNLAFGIEEEAVLKAFSQYGRVTGIRLPKGRSKDSQKSTERKGWGGYNGGFCFVEFASHEDAGAALEAMNGVDIGGRAIELRYEMPTFVKSPKTKGPSGLSNASHASRQSLSARDQEYVRTQPLVTGTVTRTGTMLKTVAVTTNHRWLDNYTKTHHVEEETVLVHDPQCILVHGDVIKYQHFPPDLYSQRAARGKTKVKFMLKEVVTPFGTPVEERTPYVPAGPTPTKKTRSGRLKEQVAVTAN